MGKRGIVAFLGCMAMAGGMCTAAFASPLPQDAEKQEPASVKHGAEVRKGKKLESVSSEDKESEVSVGSSRKGLAKLGEDFLVDQKQIWTSPARLRFSDADWLVPISGLTAGLFVTDSDFSKHLSQSPSTISHYKTVSNAGVAALVGGAGGLWLLGHVRHNEHWKETGFLAGEAAFNSLVAVESMKYSLQRERPFQGDGSGAFFQGHGNTSFPSEHAAAAWSVAGVIAHEYPGPLTKILVYSLASFVDIARVRARQHFPSDVVVGSILGNLVAQDIYSRRHDPGLGGGEWSSIRRTFRGDGTLSQANQGSPYVPLDSWVYPALDRLAALGAIHSGFAGMKPWTRNECVRLLGEAADPIEKGGVGGDEAEGIYRALEREFRGDAERISDGGRGEANVESLYGGMAVISGQPLTDGNHFGQTETNDFGRPYQEGFNSVDGVSAWTSSGRWAGYIRAEYQHSPSAPTQSDSARQFIASVDNVPGVPPATPYPSVNRVQLLDAYVAINFENWQLSYGKQSLSWSPMQSGSLMFSSNANPVNIFRISRVSPWKLPSILGLLGPIRFEWFLGQFEGHQFVFRTDTGIVGQFGQAVSRQPFLQGQKFSFKPTPNLEFSVSLTVVFGGGPGPLTWHTFFRSYSGLANSQGQGAVTDEGDGRSGVDFTYKVPGLRKWLTFYGDAMTEDEISPLGYPRKSAFQGGIYLPRIPGIPKLDLRLEGGTTSPVDFVGCVGCFYVNHRYPDGSYTNNGNLVGSWLGRASQGQRVWSTYWLTPRDKIQFQFRHQKIDAIYLPQGGTLNDGGINAEFQIRPEVSLSGSVQYEKWNYPLLEPIAKSNWTTSVGLKFWPRNLKLQAR